MQISLMPTACIYVHTEMLLAKHVEKCVDQIFLLAVIHAFITLI